MAHFEISGNDYLIIGNGGDNTLSDPPDNTLLDPPNNVIYKWDKINHLFEKYDDIYGSGTCHIEYAKNEAEDTHYLLVHNVFSKSQNTKIYDISYYEWDPSSNKMDLSMNTTTVKEKLKDTHLNDFKREIYTSDAFDFNTYTNNYWNNDTYNNMEQTLTGISNNTIISKQFIIKTITDISSNPQHEELMWDFSSNSIKKSSINSTTLITDIKATSATNNGVTKIDIFRYRDIDIIPSDVSHNVDISGIYDVSMRNVSVFKQELVDLIKQHHLSWKYIPTDLNEKGIIEVNNLSNTALHKLNYGENTFIERRINNYPIHEII